MKQSDTRIEHTLICPHSYSIHSLDNIRQVPSWLQLYRHKYHNKRDYQIHYDWHIILGGNGINNPGHVHPASGRSHYNDACQGKQAF